MAIKKRFNTPAEQIVANQKLKEDFAALNAKLYEEIAALCAQYPSGVVVVALDRLNSDYTWNGYPAARPK